MASRRARFGIRDSAEAARRRRTASRCARSSPGLELRTARCSSVRASVVLPVREQHTAEQTMDVGAIRLKLDRDLERTAGRPSVALPSAKGRRPQGRKASRGSTALATSGSSRHALPECLERLRKFSPLGATRSRRHTAPAERTARRRSVPAQGRDWMNGVSSARWRVGADVLAPQPQDGLKGLAGLRVLCRSCRARVRAGTGATGSPAPALPPGGMPRPPCRSRRPT